MNIEKLIKIEKFNRGITLISLIITIIILLILSGITITTLTGDNGILTTAGARCLHYFQQRCNLHHHS